MSLEGSNTRRIFRSVALAVLGVIVFFALVLVARADGYAYMFTGTDQFGIIDLDTGVFTSMETQGCFLQVWACPEAVFSGVHNGTTLDRVSSGNGSLTPVGDGSRLNNEWPVRSRW